MALAERRTGDGVSASVTASKLRTRTASAADLDALAPLFDGYRQFYAQPPDLARARAFLAERFANGDSVIIAALGTSDEVVGFTQLYPSFSSVSTARIWILNDLFVAKTARGMRAGVALLEAAKAHARATGAARLSLSAAHDNARAQAVYERNGWVREQRFWHYDFRL
jgi:ribosomal protein S18 acetylase RimI-like enzyme